MSDAEQGRLAANIAGGLSQVSDDAIVERMLGFFHAADPAYGHRVETAVKTLRS